MADTDRDDGEHGKDTASPRADEVADRDRGDDATPSVAEDRDSPDATSAVAEPACTRRRLVAGVAAAVLLVAAAGVLGYLKYRSTANQLADLQQRERDRAAVEELAKDYAQRSLNYRYDDPEAFFEAVEDGVSPTLKQKFVDATDFLTSVMARAQVTSTGEVVAADAVEQPGDLYEVVVSAYQTTRNLQHPEPRVSVMLLQVTVNKAGDSWQVSDIGPQPGSHSQDGDPAALPNLAPPPSDTARPTPTPGR